MVNVSGPAVGSTWKQICLAADPIVRVSSAVSASVPTADRPQLGPFAATLAAAGGTAAAALAVAEGTTAAAVSRQAAAIATERIRSLTWITADSPLSKRTAAANSTCGRVRGAW